ncbi:MAG TPA: methyltransferase domain-containing protein [Candidatus Methylomirabilis sp.]|nr:methyltransferase domain-containing protein [Candidatus Methylomirabilis sp.]
MSVVTVFEQHAQQYDDWFDGHESVYQAELAALRKFVPATGLGIEVGVGTGRFAVPLGVQFGIDPSRTMLQVAQRRGLRVCQAVGEQMPFHDRQFNLVLLVTVICFVDDVPTLFRELRRVLKTDGQLIIGFINRDSELGRRYERRKEASMFYRDARFYSVEEVVSWVGKAGFGSLRFCETLFSDPSEVSMKNLEVREGSSDGAFVVLSARKRT